MAPWASYAQPWMKSLSGCATLAALTAPTAAAASKHCTRLSRLLTPTSASIRNSCTSVVETPATYDICVITAGSPLSAPRVVKEVAALRADGFRVRVLYGPAGTNQP